MITWPQRVTFCDRNVQMGIPVCRCRIRRRERCRPRVRLRNRQKPKQLIRRVILDRRLYRVISTRAGRHDFAVYGLALQEGGTRLQSVASQPSRPIAIGPPRVRNMSAVTDDPRKIELWHPSRLMEVTGNNPSSISVEAATYLTWG